MLASLAQTSKSCKRVQNVTNKLQFGSRLYNHAVTNVADRLDLDDSWMTIINTLQNQTDTSGNVNTLFPKGEEELIQCADSHF